jgi:hypothetical protein
MWESVPITIKIIQYQTLEKSLRNLFFDEHQNQNRHNANKPAKPLSENAFSP